MDPTMAPKSEEPSEPSHHLRTHVRIAVLDFGTLPASAITSISGLIAKILELEAFLAVR
jgi:hypothetical protein